jgi:ABC-type uncharacterized transport system permease subunit
MRTLLTYVLPVAFLATVPSHALLHPGPLITIPIAVGVAVGACLLARVTWQVGLRRYTSATS